MNAYLPRPKPVALFKDPPRTTERSGRHGTLPTMSVPTEQRFLNELDKKRWTAADRLRSNLDTAVRRTADAMHGIVLLKYTYVAAA